MFMYFQQKSPFVLLYQLLLPNNESQLRNFRHLTQITTWWTRLAFSFSSSPLQSNACQVVMTRQLAITSSRVESNAA